MHLVTKMNTPICDFVKNYISQNSKRLHMPGHKGCGLLGFEAFDITEIAGADSLYEAEGIIKESEQNASTLFGCDTFYSTEGSSHCIRAMLYLALTFSGGKNKKIAAGRNAHKSFLTAAALLDLSVDWLCGRGNNYLSLNLNATDIESYLSSCKERPIALYLTSPDYLGNRLNIKEIAAVCHKYGVLLLVDNAHGAYLKFLSNSEHPIDLGADMCSDSAHKTLPVLTGGAYLQINKELDPFFKENAKAALSLFGSTSPSYLILQSLDAANIYLCEFKSELNNFIPKLKKVKKSLVNSGFVLVENEPLKITVSAKAYGYLGFELYDYLARKNLIAEFCDKDFITFMFTPKNSDLDLKLLETALLELPKRSAIESATPIFHLPPKRLSVRQAVFAKNETVDVKSALGKICGVPIVGCPPAIPIVICGEEITESVIERFEYYGIKKCSVIL